jgi:hypothetical protein
MSNVLAYVTVSKYSNNAFSSVLENVSECSNNVMSSILACVSENSNNAMSYVLAYVTSTVTMECLLSWHM